MAYRNYASYGNLAYNAEAYPEYAPRTGRERDVEAIRTGRRSQQAAKPSLLSTAAKMAAIFITVVAVLSFARIMLTSSTVTTMIESDTLSTQISQARSTGTSLEMEQSVLSNPSAIKAQAKKLKMAAPGEVVNIALTPDVVAIDGEGNLSLSDTIKHVVQVHK